MQLVSAGNSNKERLKSGISENQKTTETKNLGELFREAKARQSFQRQKDKTTKKASFDTGISNLKLLYTKQCKQGFQWRYSYKDGRGKRRAIVRVNLWALREEVANRNLKWEVHNEENARKTAEKAGLKYWEIL